MSCVMRVKARSSRGVQVRPYWSRSNGGRSPSVNSRLIQAAGASSGEARREQRARQLERLRCDGDGAVGEGGVDVAR